jgi:uncharacterized protein YjbJ (UPF0337 family)
MGLDDRVRTAAEDLAGKVKTAAGKLTGNERLEADGKLQQGEADLRRAAGKAGDAFRR